MDSAEHDELVTIRTQLTVALLAVTQLQRKHADSAGADRLLTYVATALARITREIRKVDALMVRLEDREEMRANPVRLRMRSQTGDDQGHRRYDEPVQRHAKTTDASSTAI